MLRTQSQCDADADWQPMAERSARRLHPRNFVPVGVSTQHAVPGAERLELVRCKETLVGQDRVEAQGPVPLTQDETVPALPPWVGGIVTKHSIVQDPEDL